MLALVQAPPDNEFVKVSVEPWQTGPVLPPTADGEHGDHWRIEPLAGCEFTAVKVVEQVVDAVLGSTWKSDVLLAIPIP